MKRGPVRLFLALSLVWAIAYCVYAVPWYRETTGAILLAEFELAKRDVLADIEVVTRAADGSTSPLDINEYVHGMDVGSHRVRVRESVAQCFANATAPASHFRYERGAFGMRQLVVLDEPGLNLAKFGEVTYYQPSKKPEDDPANLCATAAEHQIEKEENSRQFERRFELWRTMAWQFALGIVAIASLVSLGVWVLRGFARKPAK